MALGTVAGIKSENMLRHCHTVPSAQPGPVSNQELTRANGCGALARAGAVPRASHAFTTNDAGQPLTRAQLLPSLYQ